MEGCENCSWHSNTYTANTTLSVNPHSVYGCDSIENVNIIVHPGYHLQYQTSVVENDLPYSFMGNLFYDDVTDTLLTSTTTAGCDSNVSFTLRVARNKFRVVTDTVCESGTPYFWAGRQYTASITDTALFFTSEGADSVVVLQLTVLPSHHWDYAEVVVENNLPAVFCNMAFTHSTDTLFRYTNSYGCDSNIHYHLTVYPNHSYLYTQTICDNELPYEWHGQTFLQTDTQTVNLLDIHGADSTVTLIITVNPTYFIHIDTSICSNHPFSVGTTLLNETGNYTLTLSSTDQCDSVIDVSLTVHPHHDIHIYDTVCKSSGYTFGDITYHETGIYPLLFINQYGCDSLVTLHLGILREELKAVIKAIPLMVTLNNPDVRLYDCSHHNSSRRWLIDGHSYSDHNITYTYPVEADSLPVSLVAISVEGCTDTATTVIHIDRATIFTPNVFTPDESTNNTWQPGMNDILSLEIWIYNREGQLVCHLEGTDARWDGTKDGEPCLQGAYVYTLLYRSIARPEKQKRINGTILLLR